MVTASPLEARCFAVAPGPGYFAVDGPAAPCWRKLSNVLTRHLELAAQLKARQTGTGSVTGDLGQREITVSK